MKNITTLIFITLLAMLSTLTGCATLSDTISQNKFVVSAATRQAVGRYIARGETIEAEKVRALAAYERTQRVTAALEGSPAATYDDILSTLTNSVDWGGLDLTDKLIIQDLIELVRQELRAEALAGDVLSDADVIYIRGVLKTAAETALVFLEQ